MRGAVVRAGAAEAKLTLPDLVLFGVAPQVSAEHTGKHYIYALALSHGSMEG